ncbi:hypothetical protein [Hyphomicrobium sp.]|uniref:hypothetical protein n=1 Tax=Hyphomicrobium sp. TaxID=82 RepID=UPI002E3654A2|nr:hypothetical protein [Hyphomicrobium sp.]HEX2841919.1 hypothetical protein [Hyphomicrobium sp.]
MTMTPDGYRPPSVEATIEQIRYWVPTITDVARVYEGKDDEGWLLSIEPHIDAACPVAISLKDGGRFDISIAGEHYDDRILEDLDRIVLLLERITDGKVIQRRWVSTATGAYRGMETIVTLGPGMIWRDGLEPDGGAEHRDRHFLPYRRKL